MYRIKDRKFVGMKIRDRRKELGLSQERLAEAIGITYQQLQRYENGRSYLNTDRLQAISSALDIPLTYFFEERGEEKVSIMDRGYPYNMSSEEREFVACLRKIDNFDYKKSILIFLQLAARKGKRP
jgi:transcriptional regulator with XRE-family HTH domain